MISPNADPLWIAFPRWIEESGLPKQLTEAYGAECWLLLRKLIEMDCETNLTPDWFSFSIESLSRWTGIPAQKMLELLSVLNDTGRIELQPLEEGYGKCRIAAPMTVPDGEGEIRQRLAGTGVSGSHYILRYKDDLTELEKTERVVYLYQMVFGIRFTPRIAEELEEIANTFDMALIYQVFAEAQRKKIKSMSWIRSHLKASLNRETQENDE